jgi:hypothetical protein
VQPSTHAQSDVCRLRTFWIEKDPFVSSSWELVEAFPLVIGDRPLTKLLHHEESGTDISVGVELNYSLDKKQNPLIRLGLSFSSKPDNVFEETNGSAAESVYGKHWRFLSLTKSLEKEKRTYTFSFSCERQILKKR